MPNSADNNNAIAGNLKTRFYREGGIHLTVNYNGTQCYIKVFFNCLAYGLHWDVQTNLESKLFTINFNVRRDNFVYCN